MKLIIVKVELIVPIRVPDDYYSSEFTPDFDIEENSCPATRLVGAEIEKTIKESEKTNSCWGCKLQGSNKIVTILDI